MKPFARQAGGSAEKLTTDMHAGRHNTGMRGVSPSGVPVHDKTQFNEARPGAKDKIRKAKIAMKKRTRQRLKREDHTAVEDCTNPLGLTGEHHTQAGSTWADVQAKVDEGFISIDHHPHTVRYDADGRAVIRTPIAVAQREAARKAQEKRSRICDLLFPAERVLKSVTTAIVLLARLYSRAAVRIKTKTALRELLARQLGRFETDLPYCYRGKPYYTDEHFAKEEAKKCNQRACCFVFNERTYYLVVLRKCRNSARATHWGMEDAPPHVMLFDVDVHLLTWPSLHPLLKDLFHLITSPPCK